VAATMKTIDENSASPPPMSRSAVNNGNKIHFKQ
jgi:hypothetical protein